MGVNQMQVFHSTVETLTENMLAEIADRKNNNVDGGFML